MATGDVYELGTWVRDDAERARARLSLIRAFERTARTEGIVFGRLAFVELPPTHDRVPAPPIDKAGCGYLVGTATALGIAPTPGRFAETLDRRTRETCRAILRREHARARPGAAPLSDARADAAIENLGPAALDDLLRGAAPR